MRERRKKIAGKVVFDYKTLLEDGRRHKGQVILKMKKGPMTYTTEEGTRFFREHPFQWVKREEADHLLGFKETNFVYFVEASVEEIEDYYAD